MKPIATIPVNKATMNIGALTISKMRITPFKNTVTVKDIAIISTAIVFFCCTIFFSLKTGGNTTVHHSAKNVLSYRSK